LGREPDAVPRARGLVRAALAEDMADLAADAELVVSELVTNAALHGEPPITVRVLVNRVVRLEVEDAGRSAPIMLRQRTDAMTGRGLCMVDAVVSDWGIEGLDTGGKVVWAELDPEGSLPGRPAPSEIDVDALLEAWADDDPATATYTVRLGPVSTQLLLEAKAHIDNVVRELMLIREGEASSGVTLPPELSALIQTVTVDFAEARTEIKRHAAAAAARGDILTDLELHLSPSAADAGERYLEALDEADRYGRSAHFLTLAAPRMHRTFRRWYVQSLIRQLRSLARGEVPPEPTPFQEVRGDDLLT
jgi:anti-sigma regulatory factor (Ser/Thr protein kinase)